MSFDRALGDVEVASDFGVVTTLEQEIDDLPFLGCHGSEHFFHLTIPSKSVLDARSGWIGVFRAQGSTSQVQ